MKNAYKKSNKMLLFLLLAITVITFAQDRSEEKITPILWQEPSDIATRDLYWGAGGEAGKPDLSKIIFIKEDAGGYSTKYHVKDGSGNQWVVKLGKEAQPDTAANRLLWAVGYVTEIAYLVPQVTIEGKGRFENARFEARPKDLKRDKEWHWLENPFQATKEFQGLKVMMILLNNWDIKDANNKILIRHNAQTGEMQHLYIISDLGGSLGKTGSIVSRTRNKPEDFAKEKFIDEVTEKRVKFHYNGKSGGLFRDITVEHASWIGGWLAKLSEPQIRDAFRAANYSPEQIELLTRTIQSRINELNQLESLSLKSKN